jgi:hypothetical protein
MTQKLLTQVDNPLQKELLNLFANSGLPLHFNHKGNKQFTNYQRIALIIIFRRENKSIRDFLRNLSESKWASWLQLPKIPKKSTFHDWLNLFKMKTIKQLFNQLKPKSPKMTAMDGTGFDSFHRSRHYEKRVGFTKMPYAKVDLFVDVRTKEIIDFSLVNRHQHDIISARRFVKRNSLQGVKILCDGGYDCEDFHRQIFEKGGKLYAPVRKRHKWSNKKFPKGKFRKSCLELPDFMGQRSIIEAVNAVLKRRFIHCLRSKKSFMKKREFGWTMIVYNLDRKIRLDKNEMQTQISFFILRVIFY